MTLAQQWLNKLPNNWGRLPLKYMARITNSGVYGDEEPSGDRSVPLFACTTAHIHPEGYFLLENMPERWFTPTEKDQYVGRRDDIFVVKSSGSNTNVVTGKRAQINDEESVVLTNFLLRVRARKPHSARFLFYLLGSSFVHERIKREVATTTYPNLNLYQYLNEPLPAPPIDTQKRIADFLDRETARIDQLIEKKKHLVELLGEKEAAVVDRAIQARDVLGQRKPVNVPWLSDLPLHWEVLPIKRLLAIPITDGPHETPEFVDDGVIFISAEAIHNGQIDFSRKRGFITPEDNARFSRKYSPQQGDIYVVKSGATTGKSAMVGAFIDFNIWSPLAVLRANERVDGLFLLMVMRSRSIQDAIALNWSWGTQENIGMGVLGRIQVPVPPKEEQTKILRQISTQIEPLQLIKNKTLISIDRLSEFRSALITAAVTGQIDVETWTKRGGTDRCLEAVAEEMQV